MRSNGLLTALAVLAASLSVAGTSECEELKARFSPSAHHSARMIETRARLSKEMIKYLGTFKAVEAIDEEPPSSVSTNHAIADSLKARGLPARYRVVVSTYDDKLLTLGIVESNGSFALLPD